MKCQTGRRKRRENPDFRITGDLTSTLIRDLNKVLESDTSFRFTYMRSVWLSKYCEPSKGGADLRRKRAIEKWLAVEDENRKTNERLRRFRDSSVDVLPGVTASRFFSKMREMVSSVLVCDPSLDLLEGGFSGGATTSKKRSTSSPARKFQAQADVGRSALPIFRDLVRGTLWEEHINACSPRIVDHNVLFTVPKSSEIDRVAAKEPDLNMYLQKMLGNQIRRLLLRKGVDLNNQATNAELARIGSINGHLATIDLSSASDSVTTELVRTVVPTNWFYYLDSFRSRNTLINDSVHANNMFSSMGNGFTFELESLLFHSMARTVAYFLGVRGRINVYGDDIVVPTAMFDSLVAALAFCGFRTNDAKSFADGDFRESCGAHWYAGVDVKPVYLRAPLRRLSDVIHFANALTAWASSDGIVDPRFDAVLLTLRSYVPDYLWGGRDFESRGSLVTSHKPRKELIEKYKDLELFALMGSYLYRLVSSAPRIDYFRGNGPNMASMKITEVVGRPEVDLRSAYCKVGKINGRTIRRLRTMKQDIAYFLSEYGIPETLHDPDKA